MTKILGFSFFPAYVPPVNGGEVRLFNFYSQLSNYFDITLLTSGPTNMIEEEIIHHGIGFIERRVPKGRNYLEKYRQLENYSSGGDLSGPSLALCGRAASPLHEAYMEEYADSNIIIHDSPFTIYYDFLSGSDRKIRVYNSYNFESELYRQLHPHNRSEKIHKIVCDAEKKTLEDSDVVLYCNKYDLDQFHKIVDRSRYVSFFVPHGFIIHNSPKVEITKNNRRFSIVFCGSSHPPNIKAANFIVSELAPKMKDIDFHIIGTCLSSGKYPKNVKQYGLVNEKVKEKVFLNSDLALNPMKSGGGSNIKVLDYFAHNLPVLTTPFGMRGIAAEKGQGFIEIELPRFEEKIRDLSKNKSLLIELSRSGYNYVNKNHNWKTIMSDLSAEFSNLIGSKSDSTIIWLNDHNPFEDLGGGGNRTRALIQATLSWQSVILICFSDEDAVKNKKINHNSRIISIPKTEEHKAAEIFYNSLSSIDVSDIISSKFSSINPYFLFTYWALRKLARAIIVEHCYMVKIPNKFGDRFVYSSQNNETNLKTKVLSNHPKKDFLLSETKKIEDIAVKNSALTIAVSKEDANSFVKGRRSSSPIIIVRNGSNDVESEDTPKSEIALKKGQFTNTNNIVFIGSGHPPNNDALKTIDSLIAPKCSNCHFHIIGSVCNSLKIKSTNISLWGFVDENQKKAIMQLCKIGLNPVTYGGGSNIKISDYLKNGLYIISTSFGVRGYPNSISPHVKISNIEYFPSAINQCLKQENLFSNMAKVERRNLFQIHFSWSVIGETFVQSIKKLEVKRSKVLYVLPRYTSPPLGGAEKNCEEFIKVLGQSGKFDVDVVSPEISKMKNVFRFSENYSFDDECLAPIDIPNVRYARFKTEKPSRQIQFSNLQKVWNLQVRFEREINKELRKKYTTSGLTWGWGNPEKNQQSAGRWSLTEAGLYLNNQANLTFEGFSPNPSTLYVYQNGLIIFGPHNINDYFKISFTAECGEINLYLSTRDISNDPRSLGFMLLKLGIDKNETINLSRPTLLEYHLEKLPNNEKITLLHETAKKTRYQENCYLNELRGPWSKNLENFIHEQISNYDLVVTHNNIFRPSIFSLNEAYEQNIPSILIPHIHLDDDFYHFTDVFESAKKASIVLVSPKISKNFLQENGCNTHYLSPGCDTGEEFSNIDKERFIDEFSIHDPFILVLGRKAPAKGYRQIIKSVEQINKEGKKLHVVLIGPDDDKAQIKSPNATYLGFQPRSIIRGALLSCFALCNMSHSESFGIVVLEAWLAEKPVIANKSCAAFQDLVDDGKNGVLTDMNNLTNAIENLYDNKDLQKYLGKNGKTKAYDYDWKKISKKFLKYCVNLTNKNQ